MNFRAARDALGEMVPYLRARTVKILVFNQDWFVEELRSMGHEVVTCGYAEHLSIQVPRRINCVEEILRNLGDFSPDVLIFLDDSMPVLLYEGLNTCPIPKIFYSVDTHHHSQIHALNAPLFDHVLVAQKDYIATFEQCGTPTSWFPLWASRFVEASSDKKFGATFVGNLNADLNPRRVAFFEALQKKIPIHIGHGNYWEVFPHAEVVVNQTVKGDLNFRVFEAMMCGAVLLTERTPNGLFDLFEDGKHLVTYEPDNVEEAAETVTRLLNSPKEMAEIAAAGRQEILDNHTPLHRARQLDTILRGLSKRPAIPERHYIAMMNGALINTLAQKRNMEPCVHAAWAALKASQLSLREGIAPDDTQTHYLISACAIFDRLTKSDLGGAVIETFHKNLPRNPLISLAHIRNLLNNGKRLEAEKVASELTQLDPARTFLLAEEAVSKIMTGDWR